MAGAAAHVCAMIGDHRFTLVIFNLLHHSVIDLAGLGEYDKDNNLYTFFFQF